MDWEAKYADGHDELAPWDEVVSFVYRNAQGEHANTHICEVGCGTGPNLKFLHEQGFRVYGVDLSPTAIAKALEKVPLPHRITAGNFTSLPFPDKSFDLVIDRAALWYVGGDDRKKAIAEIHRVLKPGGKFFFTPCFEHDDASHNIHFIKEEHEVEELLAGFAIERFECVAIHDILFDNPLVSYFRVTARKEP